MPTIEPRHPQVMPTERQKMLAGELYHPNDAELAAARARARDLCNDLNATRETDRAKRLQILAELFGAVGSDTWIQPPFFCDYGANIVIGEHCYFNFNCVILDVCPVRIGDRSLFGPGVQIFTATHPLDFEQRRTVELGKPITIGSDVWIGGGAIICPGVAIGDRTVIGAGSVVTRDIPDSVLAVGNPCRVIRQLSE